MKFPVIPKKFPTTFEPRYPRTGMMVNAFAHTCSFSIAMAARGSRVSSYKGEGGYRRARLRRGVRGEE